VRAGLDVPLVHGRENISTKPADEHEENEFRGAPVACVGGRLGLVWRGVKRPFNNVPAINHHRAG